MSGAFVILFLGLVFLSVIGFACLAVAVRTFDWLVETAWTLSQRASLDEAKAAYSRGDYAKALRHIGPLAEQGNATCQVALGWMYSGGRGVRQSDAKAADWYRQAAAQGSAEAQLYLGWMYEVGVGVSQSFVLSCKWYSLATESGCDTARRAQERLTQVMTLEQTAEAQRLAREWKLTGLQS